MKNILLIGCGLLGSSLLRKINRKKIAKKVFIFEKSKKHISQIKKLSVGVLLLGLPNLRHRYPETPSVDGHNHTERHC